MATSAQVQAVERLVHESVSKVDAITPDALRSLLPALREARDELRRDLFQWLSNAPDGQDRFTAYHRTQALRSLEATFDRIAELHPAMAGALGLGRKETGALAVSNLEHEVQRLSSLFGGGMVHLPQIDTAAIVAQGNKLLWKRHERSAQRYAGGIGEDIKHRLAVSLAKGDTFQQTVMRLRGSPEFKLAVQASDPGAAAFGMSDAMFNRWRHWADRLVRTENMHAYNVQHDAAIEHVNENRSEDDEEYLRRWDASADKIACPRCKDLDRRLATIKGDFLPGVHSPPLHPYCRCVVVAWLARWGNFKGEAPAKGDDGKDLEPKKDEPKKKPEPVKPPDESQQGSKPKRAKPEPANIPAIAEEDQPNGRRTFHMDTGIDAQRGKLTLSGHVTSWRAEKLVDGKFVDDGERWGGSTARQYNGRKFGALSSIGTFKTREEAIDAMRKSLRKSYLSALKREAKAAKEPPKPKSAKEIKTTRQQDAVKAMASGKVSDARQAVDDTFRAKGYKPHAATTDRAATNVQPQLAGGKAAGLHHLKTGTIQIDQEHYEKAKAFAAEWEKDPERVRKLTKEYETARRAWAEGKGPPPDFGSEGAKLWQQAYGQHVLVHESLHGFGATLADEYFGVGAKVEEITTEVLARRNTRERYGIDYHAAMKGKTASQSFAAYEKEIQQAISAIKTTTGLSHKSAVKMLEDACDEYKKQTADTSRFPHERLAEFIAKRTRPKLMKADVYSAAHELHQPAPYGARRDGSTPSIHEMRIERSLWKELSK